MDSALPKPSKKGEELKGSKKMTKGLASTKGKRKRLLESTSTESGPTEVKKEKESAVAEEGRKTAAACNNHCFKNPKHKENGYVIQTKIWKNLKQIMATQKSQCVRGEITYASIDAPPLLKPAKKYSDLSGLPARYTDPHTKLRYANAEEYRRIQHLSSDTVAGLLALRKALP